MYKKGIPISPSEINSFPNTKRQTRSFGHKIGIPIRELPTNNHPQENQDFGNEPVEKTETVASNYAPQKYSNSEKQPESSNSKNPNQLFRVKIKQLAQGMIKKQTDFNEFCGRLSTAKHPWLRKYYKLYNDNQKYAIDRIIDEQNSYVVLQFQQGYIGTYNIKDGTFEKPVFDWAEDQKNDKKFYEISHKEDKKADKENNEKNHKKKKKKHKKNQKEDNEEAQEL